MTPITDVSVAHVLRSRVRAHTTPRDHVALFMSQSLLARTCVALGRTTMLVWNRIIIENSRAGNIGHMGAELLTLETSLPLLVHSTICVMLIYSY
jgi:hypothetical protein